MYLAGESAYGFKGVAARKSTSHGRWDGNRDRAVIKEMHLLHDLGFLLRSCFFIIASHDRNYVPFKHTFYKQFATK